MIRRPPRSTLSSSSAASDVYKRQYQRRVRGIAPSHMSDHEDAVMEEEPTSTYWETEQSGKRKRVQTEVLQTAVDVPKKLKASVGEAGKGTELAQMPRVVKNLSKVEGESTILKKLHRVLYGTDGAKNVRKKNIRAFSGYVGIDRDAFEDRVGKLNGLEMSEVLALMDLKKNGTVDQKVESLTDFFEKPTVQKGGQAPAAKKAKKSAPSVGKKVSTVSGADAKRAVAIRKEIKELQAELAKIEAKAKKAAGKATSTKTAAKAKSPKTAKKKTATKRAPSKKTEAEAPDEEEESENEEEEEAAEEESGNDDEEEDAKAEDEEEEEDAKEEDGNAEQEGDAKEEEADAKEEEVDTKKEGVDAKEEEADEVAVEKEADAEETAAVAEAAEEETAAQE
eukprot:TRINITY_DN34358_c0_g1_i1.p1 TRINITY_DN34358_c0_g1~~TRINITY_DN34358_c0_g1_i1.p1  ORF type:complete len:394 (+),score=148.35 TRINITY_DN34358_c0_g1_i1:110-1291(+)